MKRTASKSSAPPLASPLIFGLRRSTSVIARKFINNREFPVVRVVRFDELNKRLIEFEDTTILEKLACSQEFLERSNHGVA